MGAGTAVCCMYVGTFDLLQGQGCTEQKPVLADTTQLPSPVRLPGTTREQVGSRTAGSGRHITSSSLWGGENPANSFIQIQLNAGKQKQETELNTGRY